MGTPPRRSADRTVHDLDTPSVVVDLKRLEKNLASMATAAEEWRVRLRPHVKTHKSRAIARLQLASGADGLSVAKLDEAETMLAVCDDVFVAYPIVTAGKAARAAALAASTGRLSEGRITSTESNH